MCHIVKPTTTLINAEQQLRDITPISNPGNQATNPRQKNPGNQQKQDNRHHSSTPQSPVDLRQHPQSSTNQNHNIPPGNRRPISSRGNISNRRNFSSVTPYRQPDNLQIRSFCNICRRRGHTDATCIKRLKCDYCHRSGHEAQVCRTRQYEERQERFFHNLAAEQAKQSTILLQSFQRYLPPNQASLHQYPPAQGITHWSSQTNQYQPGQATQAQQYCPPVNR